MRLETCIGSVCVGVTSLIFHGRDVHGWDRQRDTSPSTCHWTVEVYIPQDPHQGAVFVFGYRTRRCKLVGVGWTLIGTLSEVWIGGHRDVDSDSDNNISVRRDRDPTLHWI